MATFSKFPSFFSLSSHKLLGLPPHSLNINPHPRPHCHRPSIRASSAKKPRAGRKVKSNAELCNDIRELLSMVGLPEGHVPSLKELSQHGRQDLANIVRRRGYKVIRELLTTSTRADLEVSNIEEGSTEKQDATVQQVLLELDQEDKKVEDSAEDISLSSDVLVLKNDSSDYPLSCNDRKSPLIKSSNDAFLEEKVANFVQDGELEVVEDVDKFSGEPLDQVLDRGEAAQLLNGNTSTPKLFDSPASGSDIPKDEHYVSGPSSVENDEDFKDEARKKNQAEINYLKLMLHHKELELSQLKEKIEKEKIALSLLQTKAEIEISKAHKLISEKDAELHAAEESLSGLTEVEVEYWGNGETVEVTGSFNGWHDRVKMVPQSSPSISDQIETRKSKLWTTILWLYPGIYEIKFIVDGDWKIDPQRESVTRGSIQNNILRVDR